MLSEQRCFTIANEPFRFFQVLDRVGVELTVPVGVLERFLGPALDLELRLFAFAFEAFDAVGLVSVGDGAVGLDGGSVGDDDCDVGAHGDGFLDFDAAGGFLACPFGVDLGVEESVVGDFGWGGVGERGTSFEEEGQGNDGDHDAFHVFSLSGLSYQGSNVEHLFDLAVEFADGED